MLSCKEVTDKLSADIDRELPLFDRLSVRLHQFICKDCRHAGMNMRALVDSLKDRPPTIAVSDEAEQVDEEFVERVLLALEEKGPIDR